VATAAYCVLACVAVLCATNGRGPVARRDWLLWTICVLLTAGQVLNDSRATYPFDSWRMYTTRQVPTHYYKVVIETERGRERYPYRLIAPMVPGPLDHYTTLAPITWRLVERQRVCRCETGDATNGALIEALVAVFERATEREVTSFLLLVSPTEVLGPSNDERTLYRWTAREST